MSYACVVLFVLAADIVGSQSVWPLRATINTVAVGVVNEQSRSLPLVISLLAFGISASSFYFQWLHARGARVTLLNNQDSQNSAVRVWKELPRNVQNDFPEYNDPNTGLALVRLVVVNTGDRPGYAKIQSASADVPWEISAETESTRVSYYTYVIVPALAVTDKLILLRNLPVVGSETRIVVHLRLETGGPAGRFFPRLKKCQYECTLPVTLVPSKLAGIAQGLSLPRDTGTSRPNSR